MKNVVACIAEVVAQFQAAEDLEGAVVVLLGKDSMRGVRVGIVDLDDAALALAAAQPVSQSLH